MDQAGSALATPQEELLDARAHAESDVPAAVPAPPQWMHIARLLAGRRKLLLRNAGLAVVLSALLVLLLPPQYESTVRIMPPDQTAGASTVLAALAGRGVPEASLTAGLFGLKSTGATYVDVLRGPTVMSNLVRRFDLQRVYGTRYAKDAVDVLEQRTQVLEMRKSGIVSITVTDKDPARAQQMAQGYVEELDRIVSSVSTSAARRQRVFLDARVTAVTQDLENAERVLGDFSSSNMALDVREQTRAMVEAGATLQAQVIAAQAELSGLAQAYGDQNVRVRSVRARIAELQRQIARFGGTSAAPSPRVESDLYPPLKKLPALGVRWADLYREVKMQEKVLELLTQQRELARIEEAKEVPTVQVVDSPRFPEQKSWPPRTLLVALLTLATLGATAAWLLAAEAWRNLSDTDPRKSMLRDLRRALRPRRWRELLG